VPNSRCWIPSTEILTSIAGAGPTIIVVFPAKSFHLLSPSYGSPAGILAELQTLTMFVLPNGTTSVVGYAVAQAPTFFLYGLVTMMF
jgi:hypothetical protein